MDKQANQWDRWASSYEGFAGEQAVEPLVRFVDEHTPPGPILELGAGTGRLAVPLAERGREVYALDFSAAMIDAMRAKNTPGVHPVQGNMVHFSLDMKFAGIYCVASTFYNLTSQEQQIDTFGCVSAHLLPDGVFIIDAMVIPLRLLRPARNVTLRSLDSNFIRISATEADLARQTIAYQELCISANGFSMLPIVSRFCWPSEQDLMARLAGLRLRRRVGGCQDEEFNRRSSRHISIYGFHR